MSDGGSVPASRWWRSAALQPDLRTFLSDAIARRRGRCARTRTPGAGMAGGRAADECAASEPKLGHYHHRWIPKAGGGWRLLEAPKPRLKRIQRWLLDEVLSEIPVSEVAHGFVPWTSVRTFVAPHVGRASSSAWTWRTSLRASARAQVIALIPGRVGYPPAHGRDTCGAVHAHRHPSAVLAEHPRDRRMSGGETMGQRSPSRRPSPARGADPPAIFESGGVGGSTVGSRRWPLGSVPR